MLTPLRHTDRDVQSIPPIPRRTNQPNTAVPISQVKSGLGLVKAGPFRPEALRAKVAIKA